MHLSSCRKCPRRGDPIFRAPGRSIFFRRLKPEFLAGLSGEALAGCTVFTIERKTLRTAIMEDHSMAMRILEQVRRKVQHLETTLIPMIRVAAWTNAVPAAGDGRRPASRRLQQQVTRGQEPGGGGGLR